ncbi:MAG: ABC transporter permease [Deltaproteobacteria bacterium]|nr:ABC transporter permease [Deltaproteobacteria bacterium]
MNIYSLVWQELWHRKSQLISGLLAITLGIGVIVGIRSVAVVSEKAVAVNLDNLGANILVLPQGASVDDYYTADIDAPTFPEDYVERIVTSTLPGLDNLSPKMTRRVKIGEYSIVLTGILPASEIASKPIWQTAGLIGNDLQATCALTNPVNQSSGFEDERLQRKSIDSLGLHDCLVGSAAAMRLGLSEGSKIKIKNSEFLVAKVLPETGIVDDDRIFAHLHTVQDLLGISHQISAIEIMGCCNAISDGLLSKLRNILPDTRITTIGQIVSTQIETNRLMNKVSLIFLVIILFVGGISIGNFMWANVNERKKEIGILLMIGTPKSSIYTMLLVKATILGLVGGVLGYAIGTIAGMILGPQLAGIIVRPVPVFLVWSILLSIVIAILGSLLPAYLAAKIEPFTIMQEV